MIDISGDGRDDVVWSSSATSGSGTWRLMTANSTGGYNAMVDTGISNTNHTLALPIQWNGDDKWDIFVPYSGNTWHVLVANGSGFNSPLSTGIASNAGSYWVADIDGNGQGDLIRATNIGGFGKVYVRLRSGSGFAAEILAIDMETWICCTYKHSIWGTKPFGQVDYNFASSHRHPDFDGDSREDFTLTLNQQHTGSGVNHQYVEMVFGLGNGLMTGDAISTGSTFEWRYGDLNGDGKTDVGFVKNGNFYYAFSRGTSLLSDTFVVTGAASPHVLMDFDGDGKDDLVAGKAGSPYWWYARSTGASLDPLVASVASVAGATPFATVGDVNGDGLHDLPFRETTAGNTWKVRRHMGVPADYLLSATDGFGVESTFSYASIAKLVSEGGCYTRDAGAPAFPTRAFRGDLIVACTMASSDGIGGTYTRSFEFFNANLHLQGRGFLGFGKVESVDSRNDLLQQTTFSQAFPHTGAVLTSTLYQPNGTTKIAKTTNTMASLSFGSGFEARSFSYVDTSSSDAWEVGGPSDGAWTVRKVADIGAIDSYGNPTTVALTTSDRDTASPWYLETYEVETVNSITNDSVNWCLGLPSDSAVTSTLPDGTSQTRTVSYTPDYLSCRHAQEVVEPASSTLKVTTTYGFDNCGNVNSMTVVGKKPDGTNMPSRITQTNFGSTCLFSQMVTNALGQVSSIAFSSIDGLPSSETDANGLVTSSQYDNFGRPKSTSRPDGTSTATTYGPCSGGCDPRVKMVATVSERDVTLATIRSSEQHYDMLDRPIYAYSDALGGNRVVSANTFDALGRLERQYEPIFDGNPWGAYTQRVHDLLDRATRVQLHDASGVLDRETEISYEGRKVVTTDAKGFATQRFVDVRGMLRRLTDPAPGGTTNYAFDHFRNLKSVTDAVSNVTSAGYDVRGFRTSTSDPDLGNWTYSFNSLGELVSQTDAKSQTTTVVYDKLSRPTSRTESEGTSSWVWGTSATAKNIGKLASLSGPGGYAESYTYDAFGRPSATTITSDTTYSINMGYNTATGLPESLTYPVSTSGYRLKTRFEYDHGILSKISDFNAPSTVFWQLNAHDERGQPMDEQLGNGARIISGFDPLTGLIEYRQTGTMAPWTNRQSLSFEWDLNGNLKKRIDGNQSNLTEEFFYDALNRLDYSQLNGVTNLDLTLDAIGNITAKTSATNPAENVGTYTYHATKKHAVASTSNGWSFGYDANGNMNSYKGNSISWTSYNLPVTINGAGQSSQFAYGPNRNRWRQIAFYPSGTETTIYVGGILEKVTVPSGTAWRHYIGAGSAKVIYTRWSTGTINTKYVTSDHLGSSTVVMDSAGAALVNLSFGSFGARRGSNWTGTPSAGDWTQISNSTRHGFTSHEQLDSVNFVHMNGRVYEPALGRFISADPFLPGILGSQAPNRYAYVGNRPQSLVDPSGFDAEDVTETQPTPRYFPQCPYQIANVAVDCPFQYGWRWDRDPLELWLIEEYRVEAWARWMAWGRWMETPDVRANASPPRPNPLPAPVPTDPEFVPPDVAQGKPHDYTLDRTLVCTADDTFQQMTAAGMSAPGAPAAVEGFTPRVDLTFGNPITQTVDSVTRTILNRTLPGHEFHDGSVEINVGPQPSDGSRLSIVGIGTNEAPLLNEFVGRLFFGLISDTVSARCAADRGIPGRRSPGEY
ncbi:MAG: FG-GAP-like repeat-containing protein [Steroidobacteraceae bacterium]